jgi:hypothetical protein
LGPSSAGMYEKGEDNDDNNDDEKDGDGDGDDNVK